jgi:hypothetical protein
VLAYPFSVWSDYFCKRVEFIEILAVQDGAFADILEVESGAAAHG